jgi:hypothetical protein
VGGVVGALCVVAAWWYPLQTTFADIYSNAGFLDNGDDMVRACPAMPLAPPS